MSDWPHWLLVSVLVLAIVVVAVIAQRVIRRILRRAYWNRLDRAAAAPGGANELHRINRQKTLVTLLESVVRYGIYGAALIAIVVVFDPTAASAIFGASVIVVALGFGFQRLLTDVAAGMFVLFEGQFVVGDVITVQPSGATGIVEDFSLRTTTLRTFGGDRVVLTNGSLQVFTRWAWGHGAFRIELVTRGDAAASIEALSTALSTPVAGTESLWVEAPSLVGISPVVSAADATLQRVVVRCAVAPGQDALVHQFAAELEAVLGEQLVGSALVLNLDAATFDTYRAALVAGD